MPLHVYNPHLESLRVYLRADGRPVVPSWGRWSLEPIGATLPEGDTADDLAERLARVRRERPTIPKELGVAHLHLAAAAFQLERQFERQQFKRALSTMAEMLASPLLEEKVSARHGGEARARPDPAPLRKAQRHDADAPRGPRLPLAVEGEG
jgi:hypothetical protein